MNISTVVKIEVSPRIAGEAPYGAKGVFGCGATYNLNTTLRPKVDGVCDKCGGSLIQRSDDAPETIEHRLDVYTKDTSP